MENVVLISIITAFIAIGFIGFTNAVEKRDALARSICEPHGHELIVHKARRTCFDTKTGSYFFATPEGLVEYLETK